MNAEKLKAVPSSGMNGCRWSGIGGGRCFTSVIHVDAVTVFLLRSAINRQTYTHTHKHVRNHKMSRLPIESNSICKDKRKIENKIHEIMIKILLWYTQIEFPNRQNDCHQLIMFSLKAHSNNFACVTHIGRCSVNCHTQYNTIQMEGGRKIDFIFSTSFEFEFVHYDGCVQINN